LTHLDKRTAANHGLDPDSRIDELIGSRPPGAHGDPELAESERVHAGDVAGARRQHGHLVASTGKSRHVFDDPGIAAM
jgi:hypothetical protein